MEAWLHYFRWRALSKVITISNPDTPEAGGHQNLIVKCFIFVWWPNLKNWLFSVFKGTKYLYEALPFKEIVIDCPKHISWRICIANSRAYQIFSRLVYNHLVRWLFHLCLNQISFVSYYMQVVKMISTKCLSLCQVPDHFLRCKFLLLIFLNSWVNIHYCIFF